MSKTETGGIWSCGALIGFALGGEENVLRVILWRLVFWGGGGVENVFGGGVLNLLRGGKLNAFGRETLSGFGGGVLNML